MSNFYGQRSIDANAYERGWTARVAKGASKKRVVCPHAKGRPAYSDFWKGFFECEREAELTGEIRSFASRLFA